MLIDLQDPASVAARVADLLSFAKGPIRRISYRQAEQEAKELAALLIAAYGHTEVRSFRYQGIPRGGLIVLGALAYALDLSWEAFQPSADDVPYVVVDDCSLTGARFARTLQTSDASRVIFAHLYSNPELRAAILASERRVIACVAARDLKDLARERYASEEAYLAWRHRWRARLEGKRYWIGQPEVVIFPWTEPDRPVWSAASEQPEDLWKLTPPDRCLRNWACLGLPAITGPRPSLRSPDRVAYSLGRDSVLLCNLDDETIFSLDRVAAAMWRALTGYGDIDAAAAYLLEQFDVDEEQLRDDLRSFATELRGKGLLEAAGGPDASDL